MLFRSYISRTHFVDAVDVLQFLGQIFRDDRCEADGRDVCDADPEDAPPEVEDAEDGKASAGDDDHDDAGKDAPEEGFPHDGILFSNILEAVFRANHHSRDETGKADADAVTDKGVDRNEGPREESPDDGADVSREEACFHAEDDADNRRDEGEEAEMNHAWDDRYWIEVRPENAGEDAEDDAVNNTFQKRIA